MNVFVIMSHPLTKEQEEEVQTGFIRKRLFICRKTLNERWMNIPAQTVDRRMDRRHFVLVKREYACG